MTVNYSRDIATVNFTTVFRIMTRWKGGVVKVLLREGSVYFSIYLIINLTYRFALDQRQKMIFEAIARYCEKYMGMIPTTFILGFYVSIVFTRWNYILNNIPWQDTPAIFTAAFLQGDAKSLLYRRTINRYMIAAIVLAMRNISMQVRKRFPTFTHVIDAGLLTKVEGEMMSHLDSMPGDAKHWVAIQWAINIVARARKEGRIDSDVFANSIAEKINHLRKQIGEMLVSDSVCIPLVYTQVVTIAVWTYFVASLFTRQIWIPTRDGPLNKTDLELDIYVPIFTVLQFICLVGWLRVAQDMLNPLGEADDDFELNAIIDRNLKVGFLMMDDNAGKIPPLGVDAFIDDDQPQLPHTEASAAAAERSNGLMPSVVGVKIAAKDQVIVDSRQASNRSSLHNIPARLVSHSSVARNSEGDPERGSPTRKHSVSSKVSVTSAALQLQLEKIEDQQATDGGVSPPHEQPPSYREFPAKPRMSTVMEEEDERRNSADEGKVAAVPTSSDKVPLLTLTPGSPPPLAQSSEPTSPTQPMKRSELLRLEIDQEEAAAREKEEKDDVSSVRSNSNANAPNANLGD